MYDVSLPDAAVYRGTHRICTTEVYRDEQVRRTARVLRETRENCRVPYYPLERASEKAGKRGNCPEG